MFLHCAGQGQLSLRWVWNVQSSVTKTCVYHDIHAYGISQVLFNIETSNGVILGYLIISRFNKSYLWISRPETYPWIMLDILLIFCVK